MENSGRLTTLLINLASILEKCDEQILPALYSRVGKTFEATPTQLGNITLARALMQALSSPLAGIASEFRLAKLYACCWQTQHGLKCTAPPLAGHFMPRGHVIGAGCLLWATFTALFGEQKVSKKYLRSTSLSSVDVACHRLVATVPSPAAPLQPAQPRCQWRFPSAPSTASGSLWSSQACSPSRPT